MVAQAVVADPVGPVARAVRGAMGETVAKAEMAVREATEWGAASPSRAVWSSSMDRRRLSRAIRPQGRWRGGWQSWRGGDGGKGGDRRRGAAIRRRS